MRQNKRFPTVFCCVFMFGGESVHGIPQLNMSVLFKPECTVLRITSFVIKTPPRERKLVRKSVFFESRWQKNWLLLALLFAIPFFSYERFLEHICRWERRPPTPKVKLRAVDRPNKSSGLSDGWGIYLSQPCPAPLPFGFENLFYLGFAFYFVKIIKCLFKTKRIEGITFYL